MMPLFARTAARSTAFQFANAQDIQLKSISRESENRTDQIPLVDGWKANLAAVEKAMISRALRMANGNKSRAAGILAIHRRLV